MNDRRYQHYEYRFKKAHLPLDLVEKVAAVLRKHGVSEEDIKELGAGASAYLGDFQTLIDEVRQLRAEIRSMRRDKPG